MSGEKPVLSEKAGRREYRKLVRDRIPEIIIASGGKPHCREIGGQELLDAAKAKMREEAEELVEAQTPAEVAEEMADILELVETIAQRYELTLPQINEIKEKKRAERGGFAKGLFLEYVED